MKKLFLISLFITSYITVTAQAVPFPNSPSRGSATMRDRYLGGIQPDSMLAIPSKIYVDTTEANFSVVKFYSGAEIMTSSGGYKIWYRALNPNAWNLFATGIVPAQFNPIQGYGLLLTGTYPNITFTVDTTLISTKANVTANLLGYVKTIGVTTGNGVSAVSSGGQDPRLTVTLGNITPTSAVFSGVVTSTGGFVGNLTGSASTVGVTGTAANQVDYLIGVNGTVSGVYSPQVSSLGNITFNPSNGVFTTTGMDNYSAALPISALSKLYKQKADSLYAPISGGAYVTNVSGTGALSFINPTTTPIGTIDTLWSGGLTTRLRSRQMVDSLQNNINAKQPNISVTGENYLSWSSPTLTANAVNVSGTNITGVLKAAAFPALTGEATTTSGSLAVTLTNSAVIGKVLTGYTSGAGTVAATDNILQAIQKLNGNIVAIGTPVTSFNSRTGAVVPAAGDYNSITETLTNKSGNISQWTNNSGYLTANQAIVVTATGDATGTSTSSGTAPSLPLVLATVNSNVGSFGSASVVPVITVNGKGLITSVTTATIVAGSTTAALTMNNGGSGDASGTTFNGGTAKTISYNTIGAPSTTGTGASGTWGINVTGNSATTTLAANSTLWGGVTYAGPYLTTASAASTYVAQTTTVAGFALSGNVTLANLTATDATLTFSGTYTGATARTVGINLGNANTWTATQTFTAPVIAKASGISTITFPAGTNDAGYIKHVESTPDAGRMFFSVSDNDDTNDYFAFGNTQGGSFNERFKITANGIVQTGTWNGTAIANAYLANSTISGISLGSNLATLTFGTHLTGTSYNGSSAVTIATDATNIGTPSTIMARDGAGSTNVTSITALTAFIVAGATSDKFLKADGTLDGTTYVPATTTIAGFALSGNVTLANLTATDATLTLSGTYNGSTARTIGLNLGNANTWSATQTFSNTIVGSINGNAATVTNGIYTTSTFYLGTTSISLNRSSASQSLTGINIDGTAGSETLATVTGRGASTSANLTLGGVIDFAQFLASDAIYSHTNNGTISLNNNVSVLSTKTFTAGAATFASSVTATQGILNGGTASTSTTTGAGIITGGIGVSGAGYFGGNLTAPAHIGNNAASNGIDAIQSGGGSILGNLYRSEGKIQATSTTIDATATVWQDNTNGSAVTYTLPVTSALQGGNFMFFKTGTGNLTLSGTIITKAGASVGSLTIASTDGLQSFWFNGTTWVQKN
jgi:fibronectin-binding autotransporter adhesin